MPNKKAKIHKLRLPFTPYWRFSSPDGAVAIYVPQSKVMTVERVNVLLDLAKRELLNNPEYEK